MSYNEESDSSDDSNKQKFRALPVADLPTDFDPSKPPTSAEEYLHHVMWEARQMDDVVTVKLDKSRIRKQPAVVRPNQKAAAPAGFAPDGATQDSILQQYLATKGQVDKLRLSPNKPKPPMKYPSSENPDHWCQFCFGNTFQRSILLKQQQAKQQAANSSKKRPLSDSTSKQDADSRTAADEAPAAAGAGESSVSQLPAAVEGQPPLLSILLNIKQATLQHLMEWHVGWLEVAGFSEHQGKWLYSLLTCLEKPLIPELCDNVRQMVFLCSKTRAQLTSASDPFLPQLNLLITIVTRYFNQEDLADAR